ncbi:hypothetical protein DM02DRAFT_618798 [Periconia macrospinosa]|uniref:Uncharacterized protein n=1 Tax=Periconia macrospinosa TaxID=97972 RepID=A0A2V1D7Z8_9PLEO|nr:hypothetical protein DM02DRAFT_618798 [Periconia macrospinosa]
MPWPCPCPAIMRLSRHSLPFLPCHVNAIHPTHPIPSSGIPFTLDPSTNPSSHATPCPVQAPVR